MHAYAAYKDTHARQHIHYPKVFIHCHMQIKSILKIFMSHEQYYLVAVAQKQKLYIN